MVLSWFRKAVAPTLHPRAASRQRPRYQKCFLELLEDRTLFSTGPMFIVNRPGDAGLGDNGTASAGQTGGDIRYIINAADQSVNANSTINFDLAGIGGNTIKLSGTAELKISQNTSIINAGGPSTLTIDGGGKTRVFNITSPSITVTIQGLTITDGNAKPAPNNSGNQGGDIFNSGTLYLTNDIVSNGNSTGDLTGPQGRGGGIFNAAARRHGRDADA